MFVGLLKYLKASLEGVYGQVDTRSNMNTVIVLIRRIREIL